MILPIFFYRHVLNRCDSLQSCAYLFLSLPCLLSIRASAIHPETIEELLLCIRGGVCDSNKNGFRMHVRVLIASNAVLHHAGMVPASVPRRLAHPLLHYGHDGAVFDGAPRADDAAIRRAVRRLRI